MNTQLDPAPKPAPRSITLDLNELNPEVLSAIIECLAEQNDYDSRLPALKAQWDILTRIGE